MYVRSRVAPNSTESDVEDTQAEGSQLLSSHPSRWTRRWRGRLARDSGNSEREKADRVSARRDWVRFNSSEGRSADEAAHLC